MLYANTLNSQEEENLLKLSRSSNTIIHRRARIILESAKRNAVNDISGLVDMHPNSVRSVINAFNMSGIDSIKPRSKSGRPRKFDSCCSDRIIELVRQKPLDFGIESGVWTLGEAVAVIKDRKIADSMCIESLRQVLRRAGLSWKRVKGWIAPSDPRYQERKQKIDDTLAMVMEDPESDLEYTDESWFVAQESSGVKNHQTGCSWSETCEAQRVPTSSKKGKKTLPIYAGMSAKDRHTRYIFTEKTNTDATIEYLMWRSGECRERGIKRLYIVWDNATFHLSKALKEWLVDHNEKALEADKATIELVPMPNKSPWLNLIEVEFRWLKRRALFCRIQDTKDILKQTVEACIAQRNQKYTPARC